MRTHFPRIAGRTDSRTAASTVPRRAAAGFFSLNRGRRAWQALLAAAGGAAVWTTAACAEPLPNPSAVAKIEAEMKPYTELLPGTEVSFEMVPINGGVFTMGSPPNEANRKEDEGPQHKVAIEPFWMGKHEVTWNEYEIWSYGLDVKRREILGEKAGPNDSRSDAVTRPTKPYTDMTFGFGHDRYPAICMTHVAAKMYCQWLSAKTGRFYRLPTEAEWEYACRAGTTTAYSFGDDAAKLGEYAWYFENGDEKSHQVGLKKPNPWGLYDMHGNVAEWVVDKYVPNFYEQFAGKGVAKKPVAVTDEEYPRVARGGSWDDDPELLRSAARVHSTPEWKTQDPQIPQSVWYFTDARHVGFRVVRPLVPETEEVQKKLRLVPLDEELIRK
jgi:formylglycine-generating enzyme required for sulfatase activity